MTEIRLTPTGMRLGTLLDAVSQEQMLASLTTMSVWAKPAGSEGERQAFLHLQSCLDAAGFQTRLIEHDAFISLPGQASLACDGVRYAAITQSMSLASPDTGCTAPLADLGNGSQAAFDAVNLEGIVVLVDGIANPVAAARAARAGARGIVHVSPHHLLHEMCISPVWGSPSLLTREDLPDIIVLTVTADDGAALRRRLAEGKTEVTLHAEVETGWRKTPLLVADLPPPPTDGQAKPFVLMSCHVDTWFEGVMDNGTANVAVLEVARLCASAQDAWRRALRVCFWSGHSQGRYSGSSWYADNHWLELEENCVAHVNLDSPGAINAEVLTQTGSAGALFDAAKEAIFAETGQVLAGKRKARSADDSFPGIGIPSVFGSLSTQPPGDLKLRNELGWWWHTAHDTIDKIDGANLVRDTRIVLRVVWSLLTDRILPLDYARQVTLLQAELVALAPGLEGAVDLAPVVDQCMELGLVFGALTHHADAAEANAALVAICRVLVPLDYTTGNRFAHDPATPLPAWPVLEPLRRLAALPPGSAEAAFGRVDAVRARNRLSHGLREALRIAARLVRRGAQ